MPTLTQAALAIRARQDKRCAPDETDRPRAGSIGKQTNEPAEAVSEPASTLQRSRRFTPIEEAILDRVGEGPASHRALVKIAEAAGASGSDARATIRRLQSVGLIGHNLTTGYVLGCFSENN